MFCGLDVGKAELEAVRRVRTCSQAPVRAVLDRLSSTMIRDRRLVLGSSEPVRHPYTDDSLPP